MHFYNRNFIKRLDLNVEICGIIINRRGSSNAFYRSWRLKGKNVWNLPPDIVFLIKKDWVCYLINVTCLFITGQNINNYTDLKSEIMRIWNCRKTDCTYHNRSIRNSVREFCTLLESIRFISEFLCVTEAILFLVQ